MEVSGGILESSSSTSTLQNLLPGSAYELECSRGQRAHYIPGYPPQCWSVHDIRRILSCQPHGSKKAPSPSVPQFIQLWRGTHHQPGLCHYEAQTPSGTDSSSLKRPTHESNYSPSQPHPEPAGPSPSGAQCSHHTEGRSRGPGESWGFCAWSDSCPSPTCEGLKPS